MLLAGGGSGGPAAVSPADARQLSVEVETLKRFRDRVEVLLHSLESGPASTREVAGQELSETHFGEGFSEVATLAAAYRTAHTKLQELSTALGEQIEAMAITIDCARNGYQGVEQQQVETLWRIREQTALAFDQVFGRSGPPSAPVPGSAPIGELSDA